MQILFAVLVRNYWILRTIADGHAPIATVPRVKSERNGGKENALLELENGANLGTGDDDLESSNILMMRITPILTKKEEVASGPSVTPVDMWLLVAT